MKNIVVKRRGDFSFSHVVVSSSYEYETQYNYCIDLMVMMMLMRKKDAWRQWVDWMDGWVDDDDYYMRLEMRMNDYHCSESGCLAICV